MIAIIPKNQDKTISFSDIKNVEKIYHKWLKNGHKAALHGYNHVYDSIGRNYIKNKPKSEFSGKSYSKQKEIILKSLNYFNKHNIDIKYFVAPGHSFDLTTIKVISDNFNNLIISDGLTLDPFKYKGVKFIPQQLNSLINIPFGTITYCLHPNNMTDNDFKKLNIFLKKNKNYFIDISTIKFKNLSLSQSFIQYILNFIYKIKN